MSSCFGNLGLTLAFSFPHKCKSICGVTQNKTPKTSRLGLAKLAGLRHKLRSSKNHFVILRGCHSTAAFPKKSYDFRGTPKYPKNLMIFMEPDRKWLSHFSSASYCMFSCSLLICRPTNIVMFS